MPAGEENKKKEITNLSKDQLFFCLRAALEAASVEFKIQFKRKKKKKRKTKNWGNWIRKERLKHTLDRCIQRNRSQTHTTSIISPCNSQAILCSTW
jgi:hypothetical protein